MITDTSEAIESLERTLLLESTRRDGTRLRELLAAEFRECGSSGRMWDREGIVAELTQEPWVEVRLSEFRCEVVVDGVALATYTTERADGSGAALRSSVWVWREQSWRIVFHQGTRVAT